MFEVVLSNRFRKDLKLAAKRGLRLDELLHEAFCLYAERDIWKPYEKHHSTVKDACELAESLGIPNLVLWHTEDSNVAGRERLYKSEGKRYYSGNIYVPDDESLIAL